jgi:hypothetical protein
MHRLAVEAYDEVDFFFVSRPEIAKRILKSFGVLLAAAPGEKLARNEIFKTRSGLFDEGPVEMIMFWFFLDGFDAGRAKRENPEYLVNIFK